MKRNRAGEDELNPTGNNSRSVLHQPGLGRAREGGRGGGPLMWGRGHCHGPSRTPHAWRPPA